METVREMDLAKTRVVDEGGKGTRLTVLVELAVEISVGNTRQGSKKASLNTNLFWSCRIDLLVLSGF